MLKPTIKAILFAVGATAMLASAQIGFAQTAEPFFRYGIQGLFGNSTDPTPQPPTTPQGDLTIAVMPATFSSFTGQVFAAVSTVGNAVGSPSFEIVDATAPIASIGLVLNPSSGAITGTLTNAGAISFRVRVTDGASRTATSSPISVTAVSAQLAYSTSTGAVGSPISSDPPSTNLPAPTFALASGAPPWASIDPTTGIVSGTPPSPSGGSPTAIMVVATSGPVSTTAAWSVSITAPTVQVLNVPSAIQAGQATTMQATTTLQGTITYSINNAPAWLAINASTGVLTGTGVANTPATNFTVTANNGVTQVTSVPYTISITAPLFVKYRRTIFGGQVGYPSELWTSTPEASNVSKTFSVFSGTLPPGVTINATTGVIRGYPTTPGEYAVTVGFTAAAGTASQDLLFRIGAASPSMTCFGARYLAQFDNWSTGSVSGQWTIPQYNRLRIYIVGAGGGGGDATNPTTRVDGTPGEGSGVSIQPMPEGVNTGGGSNGGVVGNPAGGTFNGGNLFAPGGRGGQSTTPTFLGGSDGTDAPQAANLGGQVLYMRTGTAGSPGLRTQEVSPQTWWALGGSTSNQFAEGPRFDNRNIASNQTTASNAWRAPGVGGSGVCYTPNVQNRAVFGNFTWICGGAGASGSELVYEFDRSIHPLAPEPGRVLNYYAGAQGGPNFSVAGYGGAGQVCFSVE